MPVIPTLRENQRLSQGGVGGFQDTRIARSQGESIGMLGRAVATLGKDLQTKEKEDAYTRGQFAEQAKAVVVNTKNKLLMDIKETNKYQTGEEYEQEYERRMSDAWSEFSNNVPDMYKVYSERAFTTAKLTNTADVYGEMLKKKQAFKANALNEVTNNKINSLAVDPTKFEETTSAVIDDLIVATNNGLLQPEQFEQNVSVKRRQILDATINGYVNKATMPEDSIVFTQAEEFLVKNNENMFTPEEFNEKVKYIRKARTEFLSETWKLQDRSEQNTEKRLTAKSDSMINEHTKKMFESRDPDEIEQSRKALLNELGKDKNRFSRKSGYAALNLADDMQDAMLSYEVYNNLGVNPSLKRIKDERASIVENTASGILSHERGYALLKELDTFSERQKADPMFARSLSAAHHKLKEKYNISDFEKALDFNNDHSRGFVVAMSHLHEQVAKNKDADPLSVVYKYLREKGPMLKDSTGAPANLNMSYDTLRNLESDKDFSDEEVSIRKAYMNNDINVKAFETKLRVLQEKKRVFDIRKSEALKKKEELEAPMFSNPQKEIPFR